MFLGNFSDFPAIVQKNIQATSAPMSCLKSISEHTQKNMSNYVYEQNNFYVDGCSTAGNSVLSSIKAGSKLCSGVPASHFFLMAD